MDPLIFEPYLRPQIWGGRQLETALHKRLPPAGTFGESWELSAHPHHVSRVAEGPFASAALTQIWTDHAEELTGSRSPGEFPLLIKSLDCRVPLSVQVHPDDARAHDLLGEPRGKTEAWVILAAGPDARIWAGLKPGITRADLERHLDAGTVADCLHSFVPRPGDCVYLPAGTVHAVGGGVLIAEVQQSSDATFRLFDWNRPGPDGKPRTLHREQSLASIDWQAGPVDPVRPQRIIAAQEGVSHERLVECPYFALSRYTLSGSARLTAAGLSIWMMLDGSAELRSKASGDERRFERGETVLIPASAPSLEWTTDRNAPATLLAIDGFVAKESGQPAP